ncbi:hypothetical protein JCM31826_00180 [Thermaurantimonas aggregans]|uniref:YdhG-like domain-containing protein n=1 Tax=Thermaurantimonas aggregans TaxID=2173829 RepID=A0A401XHP8_9FLAO|nr:DUF1801 domain-containing protein [Thermaurantimonas aggregans]MCX8149844.1 DUF1801 domain-containing protein [Thermaurantimonas aggregans]GCD76536.1 hypothetical protein JCM31826_00180 [Thermaurantimonas aggregans]
MQNKTTFTGLSVDDFIESAVKNPQKKADSYTLIRLFKDLTGKDPKMYGPSIIGFGTYHYRYASGHSGEAPVLGFSPRASAISLYIYSDTDKSRELLQSLGKFEMGKACIYVKKLSDIDLEVLKALCKETIRFLYEQYSSDVVLGQG